MDVMDNNLTSSAQPPRAWIAAEAVLICAAAAFAAAMLPLTSGYFALSWDAMNHHVYLGYIAETGRLKQDVIAASYQSYQYPYLYWPVYRLAMLSGPGDWIGAAWAASQTLLLMPAVWLIAYRIIPHTSSTWADASLRAAACALAMLNTIILSVIDSTGNDALAAVPLLWAIAIMAVRQPSPMQSLIAAGLFGISAAFKLSNAVFLPILLVWVLSADWKTSSRSAAMAIARLIRRGSSMGFCALLAFCLAYAPWGVQLWQATGDPFYPYFQGAFPAHHLKHEAQEVKALTPTPTTKAQAQ